MKKAVLNIFWLLLIPTVALAVQIKTLYEVEVPIETSEGATEQKLLLREAFQEVLVRVSGSDKVLGNKLTLEALENPDKYIVQFSYHEPEENLRTLRVKFNEKLVNQLLDTSQVNILGKSRPSILVWVIVEQDGVPYFAGLEPNDLSLVTKMDEVFLHRAIPVFFPMLDLTDTERVSEIEIQEESFAALETASKRYHPEAILVGRLLEGKDDWQAKWVLLEKDRVIDPENLITWTNAADDLDVLLQSAADELSQKLIQEQDPVVHTVQAPHPVSIIVSGIVSAKQYNTIFSYLQRLPFIKDVEVSQITSHRTIFDVETTATHETMKKIFSDDQLLEEENNMNGSDKEIFFRVMG